MKEDSYDMFNNLKNFRNQKPPKSTAYSSLSTYGLYKNRFLDFKDTLDTKKPKNIVLALLETNSIVDKI